MGAKNQQVYKEGQRQVEGHVTMCRALSIYVELGLNSSTFVEGKIYIASKDSPYTILFSERQD
jgi:hypothetical protein